LGQWAVINNADADPESEGHFITLTDAQTAAEGARLDLTITAADAYELKIDPFGPGATYTETGALLSAGMPIDWIEFTFFSTVSDPAFPTDFYIRSLEITGPAAAAPTGDFDNDGDADGAEFLAWQRGSGITTGAMRAQGDANADGHVDAADLSVWGDQFGDTSAAIGVPEPGAFAIAACGAACLSGRARRRRARR